MNFLYRTLVALIGIPILIFAIFGKSVFFFILCFAISAISFYELEKMAGIINKNSGRTCRTGRTCRVGFFFYVFILISLYVLIYITSFKYIFYAVAGVIYILLINLILTEKKDDFLYMSFRFVSVLYIFFSPLFLLKIRTQIYGSHFILYLFLIIWSVDTLAYIGGCSIRGPKLAPSISPKKTIAGFISGIIGGILVWCVYSFGLQSGSVILKSVSVKQLIFITLILSVVSQIGDLFESRIKRIFNVKDSSNIIPGHGGILDRFDSLIFAGPIYYIIISIF